MSTTIRVKVTVGSNAENKLVPVVETSTTATSSIHPMKRADELEGWLAASVEDFDQWEAEHQISRDDDV